MIAFDREGLLVLVFRAGAEEVIELHPAVRASRWLQWLLYQAVELKLTKGAERRANVRSKRGPFPLSMYQFDAGRRGKRFHLIHRSCCMDSDPAMMLLAGTEAPGSPVESELTRLVALPTWQSGKTSWPEPGAGRGQFCQVEAS